MRCSRCQRDNPADARFCTGCGAALELACPDCGTANTADSRFCKTCGGALGVAAGAAIAAAVRGPALDGGRYQAVRTATAATPAPPAHLAEGILAARALFERYSGANASPLDWLRAYVAAGDYAAAARPVAQILRRPFPPGWCGVQAERCWLFGECAALGDPPDLAAAEAHYRQALDLAEACERRPLAAQCRLGLGAVFRLAGRRDEARTLLAEALAAFQAMDMPCWRTRAQAELAALD